MNTLCQMRAVLIVEPHNLTSPDAGLWGTQGEARAVLIVDGLGDSERAEFMEEVPHPPCPAVEWTRHIKGSQCQILSVA